MRHNPKRSRRRERSKKDSPISEHFNLPAFTFDVAGHRVKTIRGQKGNFKIRVKGKDTDITLNAKKFGGVVHLFKLFQKAIRHVSYEEDGKPKRKKG